MAGPPATGSAPAGRAWLAAEVAVVDAAGAAVGAGSRLAERLVPRPGA